MQQKNLNICFSKGIETLNGDFIPYESLEKIKTLFGTGAQDTMMYLKPDGTLGWKEK